MPTPPPLHTRVYGAMAERIRSGEWTEGDQLPSEKALVEEFGTSRGPVRQALARLRSEGLIAGGRGAPPRVQKVVPSQSFDTFISFTEWSEELGYPPIRKTIEMSRRLADEQAARRLGAEPGAPFVFVSRLRKFEDDPVMLEQGYYPLEAGQHLLAVDLDRNSIYQILKSHGIVPTRAHNVIDAVAAADFAAKWLELPVGAPLLRLRRTAYDERGRVVDFVENLYRPDMATFAIDNARHERNPLRHVLVDS